MQRETNKNSSNKFSDSSQHLQSAVLALSRIERSIKVSLFRHRAFELLPDQTRQRTQHSNYDNNNAVNSLSPSLSLRANC